VARVAGTARARVAQRVHVQRAAVRAASGARGDDARNRLAAAGAERAVGAAVPARLGRARVERAVRARPVGKRPRDERVPTGRQRLGVAFILVVVAAVVVVAGSVVAGRVLERPLGRARDVAVEAAQRGDGVVARQAHRVDESRDCVVGDGPRLGVAHHPLDGAIRIARGRAQRRRDVLPREAHAGERFHRGHTRTTPRRRPRRIKRSRDLDTL